MFNHKLTFKLVVLFMAVATSRNQGVAQTSASLSVQRTGSVVAASDVQTFLQPTNGQQLLHDQILGLPTSDCRHVIDLLMTNRLRQQTNNAGTPEVFLPHLTFGQPTGDLQLLSVHLVSDGDGVQGPIFQVGLRNHSTVAIGDFRISLVGVLGQIHVHSPTATICIPRMECGEERVVQIQLPATCLALPCAVGTAAFDTLIVAVDSFDELVECDELNNVQILRRCDVPAVVVEAPVTEPLTAAPENLVQPADPGAPAAPAVPLAPEQPAAPAPENPRSSPLDQLDLDQLDLNEAQNLLFRR